MSRLLICAALLGAALFGFIVRSVLQQVFERWWTSFEGDAAERGRKEGYARGRREIDKWWIEMDQQLDEEWAKIWREER